MEKLDKSISDSEDTKAKSKRRGISTSKLKAEAVKCVKAEESGTAGMDEQVENALYESARGGNTTASIFWLKNRRPDLWREKPENPVVDNGILRELIECWNKKKEKPQEG